MNVGRYIWQRATAAIMLPLVLLHVAVIFYATRQGMTAADILARTRGSIVWASVYGAFVVAVALHAPIGLRNVIREWTPWRGRGLDVVLAAFAFALFVLGMRAVIAVYVA